MAGKIFYRQRRQSECGVEQPRFQVVAVADAPLEVLGKHLRLNELDCIATSIGAELVLLDQTMQPDQTSTKVKVR